MERSNQWSSQCSLLSQKKECPPPQLISPTSLPVPESVSSTVGLSSPPPRSDGRKFFKHIKRTPVPSEACQEILGLYDFEKAIGEQSPAVLSRLEKLMGYEGYPWLNDADRAHVLCYKANRILERYLGAYGFYWLCDTLVEGKPRKIISPKQGATPSPLPEWLSTPYLIRVPSQDVSYKPDSPKDPIITGGYSILDSSKKEVGSFSCLMQTTKSPHSSDLTWICPTAGHILDDIQTEAFMIRRDTDQEISLQVAPRSVRLSGRPSGRRARNERPSFRDDCAFLIVGEEDLPAFQRSIPNLDPFFYNGQVVAPESLADPISFPRRDYIYSTMKTNGIIVHKFGASTDLTVGFLVEILTRAPQGWYETDEDPGLGEEEPDLDCEEWLGVVKWVPGFPFSGPGDSGSLVCVVEKGVTIPLGIHVGAPESTPERSIFISLETFCYVAEEDEGWELRFP